MLSYWRAEVSSQHMQDRLCPGDELPQVSTVVWGSGPSTSSFTLEILCQCVVNNLLRAVWSMGVSTCVSCEQAPSPGPVLPFLNNLAVASHRGAPQLCCHSQNWTFAHGFNFFFSLLAKLLYRFTHSGNLEGKAQFTPRQRAHEASY